MLLKEPIFMNYKRDIPILTFILGVLFISYFHLNPLAGFGLAFFFSWLVYEDYATKLIDTRISLCFFCVSIICCPGGTLTGLAFFFLMLIILYGTTKFVPKNTLTEEQKQDTCLLQDDTVIGFLPVLGLSVLIYLGANMMLNIEHHAIHAVEAGNPTVTTLWAGYHNLKYLSLIIANDPVYAYGITFTLASIAGLLKYRIIKKEKQGLAAEYAMGDGDPLVLGSMAVLFGGVIFFYVILMGSLILGETQRLISTLYKYFSRIYKEGACL